MTQNYICWLGYEYQEIWKYPLISITPSSTQTHSDNTY